MAEQPNRVAGTLYFKVDGQQLKAKGSWTYNPGGDKRTTLIGADGVHGYSSMPTAPFIEGTITVDANTDMAAIKAMDGVTCTLELANGKTWVLRDAWYVADGDVTTENSEGQVRFEGLSMEPVE